jgi:hypothetical protein
MRKQNLRDTVAFSDRAPGNKRQRREGRAFVYDSVTYGEWANTKSAARGFIEEIKPKKGEIGRSMRFGFLDSGD